jgi:hypothetical protein
MKVPFVPTKGVGRLKYRTILGTEIRGSVNYSILFYLTSPCNRRAIIHSKRATVPAALVLLYM